MSEEKVEVMIKITKDLYDKIAKESERVLYNAPVSSAIVTILDAWANKELGTV